MIIYLITNRINWKTYIGQTKKSFNKRWAQHCDNRRKSAMNNAIQKYGKDNFDHLILFESNSLEEINRAEQEYISKYSSRYPNGYNIHPGGDNHAWTEDRKKAFSLKRMGPGNPKFGKKVIMSDETKDKIRKAHLGQRNFGSSMRVQCIQNGITYESMTAASAVLGISRQKISLVCNGKRKHTGGFTFRKIEK